MTESIRCGSAERFIAGRGMFDRGRPLKRWRWVGVFSEDLMVCAAEARIGPARQSFWALHSPPDGGLHERTRLLPRRSELEIVVGVPGAAPGRLRIADRGVRLDLELEEEAGFEARCANGRSESWTRKQAGIAAHGTLALDGGTPRELQARAVIDDSAGWHQRVTEWRWSAGVGEAPDGTPLAWNLVTGINDPERGSERAVWVDGVPTRSRPSSSPRTSARSAPATGRSCASPPRPSARGTRTCCSSAPTTARRSGPSRGRCPATSSWRQGAA
jgi:hypothetical protein